MIVEAGYWAGTMPGEAPTHQAQAPIGLLVGLALIYFFAFKQA